MGKTLKNQPLKNTKKENIFPNLNAEQARQGYTNQYVANKIGISRISYESKKKTGKFHIKEAKMLCTLFGCKLDYLFEMKKSVFFIKMQRKNFQHSF